MFIQSPMHPLVFMACCECQWEETGSCCIETNDLANEAEQTFEQLQGLRSEAGARLQDKQKQTEGADLAMLRSCVLSESIPEMMLEDPLSFLCYHQYKTGYELFYEFTDAGFHIAVFILKPNTSMEYRLLTVKQPFMFKNPNRIGVEERNT